MYASSGRQLASVGWWSEKGWSASFSSKVGSDRPIPLSPPLPEQPADAANADLVPGGYVPSKLASFVVQSDLLHIVPAQPPRQAPNPALAVG